MRDEIQNDPELNEPVATDATRITTMTSELIYTSGNVCTIIFTFSKITHT